MQAVYGNFNYRLIKFYIFTFASEFWQNNARMLRFWCIGQALKLKQISIILSQFSSIKQLNVLVTQNSGKEMEYNGSYSEK